MKNQQLNIARGSVIPISEFAQKNVHKPASFPTPTHGTYHYVRVYPVIPGAHNVGDQVTIALCDKRVNPYYNGKSTVVATGVDYIDLNVMYTAKPYQQGQPICNDEVPVEELMCGEIDN